MRATTTRVRALETALALAGCAALLGCAPLGLYRPGTEDQPEVLTVDLTDTSIEVSPSVVAQGKVGLEIVNDGQLEHSVQVVGPGTDETSDELFTHGEHRRLWLKLKPGTFRIFCPDGDHAARGMSTHLTVTEEARWFRH
jgi:hypothetical protein